MGKIRIADQADASFAAPDLAGLTEKNAARLALLGKYSIFEGGPEQMEAFEVTMPPGFVVEPHAHEEAEVVYILDGSIVVGSRELSPGSAVSVDAFTLYGFRAGAAGVRFLNVRPKASSRRNITKQELLARRRGNDPDA